MSSPPPVTELGAWQEKQLADTRPNSTKTEPPKPEYTHAQMREAIDTYNRVYEPAIQPVYQTFKFLDPLVDKSSPIQLFLTVFAPVLQLLVYHTNLAAKRANAFCDDITALDMRRWIACRLEMTFYISEKAAVESFWSTNVYSKDHLPRSKYRAIEAFLCLNSAEHPPPGCDDWSWRVIDGMNAFRQRLYALFEPSSYVAVDESAIKFHGRQSNLFDLRHKPQNHGFLVLNLASHGGLIHDCIILSSKHGIEGDEGGLTINLATRTTRKRKHSHTGTTPEEVHLPPMKSALYRLCERVHIRFPTRQFICFMDNLFTDPHLARALLEIQFGTCGTVRGTAPGQSSLLKAIKATKPCPLRPDEWIIHIVDKKVMMMMWNDPLRGHIVALATTAFSSTKYELAPRKTKYTPTRKLRGELYFPVVYQPQIVVQYNIHMGEVDNSNHLRATRTVRRGRQKKWTKKFIEFLVDASHTNAYLTYHQALGEDDLGHRSREHFIKQLIRQLVDSPDQVHQKEEGDSFKYCQWKDCRTRSKQDRPTLVETSGNARASGHRRTTGYCKSCRKTLCIHGPCFKAFHEAHGLSYEQ